MTDPDSPFSSRERIAAADIADDHARLELERLTVIHGQAETVEPIPGSAVFIDPPYVGAPRYAALFPRPAVLATAERHRATARRVTVCERVRLPLEGWRAYQLAPGEWITVAGDGPAPRHQVPLPFQELR